MLASMASTTDALMPHHHHHPSGASGRARWHNRVSAATASKPNARRTSSATGSQQQIPCSRVSTCIRARVRATSRGKGHRSPSMALRDTIHTIGRLVWSALGFPSLLRAYHGMFQSPAPSRVGKHAHVNLARGELRGTERDAITTIPTTEMIQNDVDPSVREWVSRVKEGRLTPEEKRAFLSDTQSGRHTWSSLRNKPVINLPLVRAPPCAAGKNIPLYTSNLFGNRTTRVILSDTLSPSMAPYRENKTEEPWLDNTRIDSDDDGENMVLERATLCINVTTIGESDLHRQTQAYREQQRGRMHEIANQKLLSSVTSSMASKREFNTPEDKVETIPPNGITVSSPWTRNVPKRETAPVLEEYAVIDERRSNENYWRQKLVQQAPAKRTPSNRATIPRVADSTTGQRRQDVTVEKIASIKVVETTLGLSTVNSPPTFSYLKSFISDAAETTSEPRPLPFLKDLPRRKTEATELQTQTSDPAVVPLLARQGSIRTPIPLENKDPGTRTVEEDRKARQSIRDAMTRSLTTTVSQDSRAKKWGIDMNKL